MKKTIVIADDNLKFCKSILYSFNNIKDINVVGIAKDGNQALRLLNKYTPDLLILDLNMPNKNGIEVLNEIEKSKNCKTKVIIISGEISMINNLNLMQYKKVNNIFVKPFDISMLYSVIKNINNNTEDILNIINDILHNFSFNFASQFYKYLLICIEKSLYKPFILNEIYKEVAVEQQINPNRLKWGIEKLILSMIRYTPNNILTKYIPSNPKPTPKVFIYETVNRVKKQIKQKK